VLRTISGTKQDKIRGSEDSIMRNFIICNLHQILLGLKSTIFWDITSCNPLRVIRRFGGTYRLHLQGRKISRARNQRERWFLAQIIFSTLKMEATCFSETSADTQRTTRRYIPEDGTLHNHRCENLTSYIIRISVRPAENSAGSLFP
jgi:hypothetical protein